jgi:hypothetical protein
MGNPDLKNRIRRWMNRLLDVRHRTFVIYSKYFADLLLFVIAAPIAYILRLESTWFNYTDTILIYTMVGLPVKMMSIYFFRLHMQSWRTASLADSVCSDESDRYRFRIFAGHRLVHAAIHDGAPQHTPT